jgi:hypothetical protein
MWHFDDYGENLPHRLKSGKVDCAAFDDGDCHKAVMERV